MFDINEIPEGGVSWLDASGEYADIVLSTRVRLARNVEGYAFAGRARDGERLRVLTQVHEGLSQTPSARNGLMVRVDELGDMDRMLLHERHVVSKELAGLEGNGRRPARSGAAVQAGRGFAIMINEEDHLRIQSMRSGLALEQSFSEASQIETELGAQVPYSYHREFGFLTACPTNVGTGLRASVLIHLPALVLTKEIGRVLAGLQQVGLTYRGLYGEGSEVIGNFFQISNQTTLGRSDQELLEYLDNVVRHVIEKELEARRVLVRDAGYIIEDKLWRAYGTLRYARSLSFDEAMNFLSGVRLAVGLKLITGLSVYTLNKLLIFCQTAHIAHQDGISQRGRGGEGRGALTEDEANVVRANFVRETLDGSRK